VLVVSGGQRDDLGELRLVRGEQLQHGHLDQQPEPMPAVRPGHRGQLLESRAGVLRIHSELGDRYQLSGAVGPRGHRVEPPPLLGYQPVLRPDPGRVPAGRVLAFGARGVVFDVEERRDVYQPVLGDRPFPGHQRVPGRRRRRAFPQSGQAPLGQGARAQRPEDPGHPLPGAERAGERRPGGRLV